jgi:hypothetical protein
MRPAQHKKHQGRRYLWFPPLQVSCFQFLPVVDLEDAGFNAKGFPQVGCVFRDEACKSKLGNHRRETVVERKSRKSYLSFYCHR